MASPALSRSSSTSAFAPGPHRRSHLNLQNISTLSLAPLTPRYPIDPADYDAYFDPSTSELHTSASLSRIATLPSPGGILTNSPVRSRDPSRTRKQRRIKSHVHIREPEETQSQLHKTVTEPIDSTPNDRKPKPSRSQLRLSRISTADPSWLVQTGLSLTESSRETKGQSWLSKRDSSTSLATTPADYFSAMALDRQREGRTPRSGRATPATGRSRVSSRNTSRTRRGDTLRMTMTAPTSEATSPITERGAFIGMRSKTASFVTAADLELDDQIQEEEDEDGDIQPNWADARTQAELAAQLQEELAEDYNYYGNDDGDPYGMLNFEEQGSDADSDQDEEEVRKAMSRYRLGGWMGLDGAIDALLRVEQVNDGNAELDVEQGVQGGDRRGSLVGDIETPPVPQRDGAAGGAWVDVTWLGRLFGRSAGV